MDPKTKYFFAQVKDINEQARTIDAVASTSELDRDKDVILPIAFKESLDAFKANPVILACHQHRLPSGSSPVIGSAMPESIKIGEKEVTFTMGFAETALGQEYWQLYRDKHMRAFSIGFIPIEYEDKKDEKLGWVRTYTKIELLEISAVPVPSNRSALARAKELFRSSDELDEFKKGIETLIEETRIDITKHFANINTAIKNYNENVTAAINECADDIKSMLVTDRAGFAERLLGDAPEQSACGDKEKTERIMKMLEALANKK